MAIRFPYNESTLAKNLGNMSARLGAVVLLYAGTKASVIQGEMQNKSPTHPWTDRTGAAKAGLRATVTMPNDHTVRITLAHGKDYGVFLELAREKKHAIIAPTVKKFSAEIVEDLEGIMERV